jgi:putative YphP/YqiW family bacilliredoxin
LRGGQGAARSGAGLTKRRRPDRLGTAFARDWKPPSVRLLTGYDPSSPSIGILRNGELVYMLERWQPRDEDRKTLLLS